MNLQAVGITAEYNPFHNGHLWQLRKVREKLGNIPVIACMSGCFVQRGEAALADPWTRAAMAVHAGVDLVLLLPSWYCLRSADYFASGAVKTLAATGLINALVCGTESPAPKETTLLETAVWSLKATTERRIKNLLQQGLSYGAAWETAAIETHKDTGWFRGANNLLALAYQKALLKNHLPLKLLTFPRQGSGYHDAQLTPPYASASAIRTALRASCPPASLTSFLPPTSIALLKLKKTDYPFHFIRQEEILTTLLTGRLIQNSRQDLYENSSASADLCNRFYNARHELQQGYNAFCNSIANKRDPLPSVHRLALQLLLQKPRMFWMTAPEPAYLRVLAFNDRGRSLLKEMKKTATLPVITKPMNKARYKQNAISSLLQLDTAAADLFQLLNGNAGRYGTDLTTSPIYIQLT